MPRLAHVRKLLVWLAMAAGSLGPACRRVPARAPASTTVVSGSILTAQGKPLAGASVALTRDPDDGRVPIAVAKAGPSGRFRIDRVPIGGGSYQIHARASGFVAGTARLEVPLPAGKEVDLRLIPTVGLAGHIQDQHGTPVPLARLLVFSVADAPASTIHEVRADERGAFKIDGLAPGAHRLLIEAPGLGTASAGPLQAPDASVIIVLPGSIRAISGRVTRAGQAVNAARVLLGGEAVTETRTIDVDAHGRFAFAGLGPGAYVLRAEAGGLISPPLKQIIPAGDPSPSRQVELSLAPGTFARGRVVSEDGHPVAGASVQLDLVPATGLWPPVSTNTDGTWTSAPLGPGTYQLRARHPGFVARRTAMLSVSRNDGDHPVQLPQATLELTRTGEIIGRVVNDAGAPVLGATIHDRLAETEELGVIWARLPLAAEAAALPGGGALPSPLGRGPPSRRAISDATGAFVLGDVPPGRVQVEVLSAASVPLHTQAVTLVPGARLDVGTLRVSGAVQLVGRVEDADGRPIAGARVVASRPGAAGDGATGLYASTGTDGTFGLPVVAGELRVTASVASHGDASATVRLTAEGNAASPVILRFSSSAVTAATGSERTVNGAVHDTDGRPLVGARVSLRPADIAGVEGVVGSGVGPGGAILSTVRTDPGGAFHATGVSPGRLTLDVQHDGYPAHRQLLEGAEPGVAPKTVNIVVPVPGGIDGEVHERVTGAPVPRFRIDARGPDGAEAHYPEAVGSRRRPLGPLRFSLRRLLPGRWTLRVQAPGYRAFEQVVEVTPASSPGEVSLRDLRLELERS